MRPVPPIHFDGTAADLSSAIPPKIKRHAARTEYFESKLVSKQTLSKTALYSDCNIPSVYWCNVTDVQEETDQCQDVFMGLRLDVEFDYLIKILYIHLM